MSGNNSTRAKQLKKSGSEQKLALRYPELQGTAARKRRLFSAVPTRQRQRAAAINHNVSI